jgi:hypothetical protein
MPTDKVDHEFVTGLPPVGEVRRRIAANIKERHFLRSLLRLAEKREDAEQAKRDVDRASLRPQ